MNHDKRIKKGTYIGRHLLPSGKFYYKIYQDRNGEFFSDPATVNCETPEELKAFINKNPKIQMNNQEHFARMNECQNNMNELNEMRSKK